MIFCWASGVISPCLRSRAYQEGLTARGPCGTPERALKSSHHGQSCVHPPARTSCRSWACSAASPGRLQQPPHLWSWGRIPSLGGPQTLPGCGGSGAALNRAQPLQALFSSRACWFAQGEKKVKTAAASCVYVQGYSCARCPGCAVSAAAPARLQRHLLPSARASCAPYQAPGCCWGSAGPVAVPSPSCSCWCLEVQAPPFPPGGLVTASPFSGGG